MNSVRKWWRGAALFSLALLAAGAVFASAPDQTEAVLRARLEYLASPATQGRRTGEKGNEIAARYIAQDFKNLGLKPVGTRRQGDAKARPDGTGYFQPWTFAAGVAKGTENRLMATVGSKSVRYRTGVEYEPSPLSSSTETKGEVVFVGYGQQTTDPARDDYAGVDVKDKVVLVVTVPTAPPPASQGAQAPPRARPRASSDLTRRVQAARDKGAIAVFVLASERGDVPRLQSGSRGSDSGLPVIYVRRSVAASWLRAAGKDLESVLKSLPTAPQSFATGVTLALKTDVVKVTKTSANIVGLLPGSDPAMSAEVVVIGAHMDHLGVGGAGSLYGGKKPQIHPGADDNASGTAGMMAVAARLAAERPAPKRSILFMAFSGEELGLLGAAHYVKNPILPLDKTVAMINLDMIGRMRDNKLSAIGVNTSEAWAPMLDDLNKSVYLNITRSGSAGGGSDHQPFANAKIPVLFFITGTHPDYHKPSDTPDKINYWDAARVANLTAAIGERVANSAERPRWSDARAPVRQPGAGPTRLRASLGVMPEYEEGIAGVKVSDVRAGGPAEKAGLKAGDVVVKLAGKTVKNIEEYMAILAELNVGDSVDVTVMRAGQPVSVKVTLAESRR